MNEKIINVDIGNEVKDSFLVYAMSVIVSRALPDVYDGMKPVHRRIIYAMNEMGCYSDKPYKKSARIVGDVMGRYHPHGDSAIYESLVRMGQDFSTRYLLIDGQGNFGSIDGDDPAAMRYTEARMSKLSMELVKNIDKEIVDFQANYSNEFQEPKVLPSYFPNLLANGSSGIAVGMATNIPPHNLKELIAALELLIDDENTSLEKILELLPGPDFPTGAIILAGSNIKKAYETGRQSIIIRSKTHFEEYANGKKAIIVDEIPYQVNKANLIEKIANLVKEKKIDGISDLRDESNRNGIRIVIELKRDIQETLILNQLFRLSQLQVSYGINLIALVDGKPQQLSLLEMLKAYIKHQVSVTTRAFQYDLTKFKARLHILDALKIVNDHIDEVLNLIRSSQDDKEAASKLTARFGFSDAQNKAILDTTFRRLTSLEKNKIIDEHQRISLEIARIEEILANKPLLMQEIKNNLEYIKNKYGDERRSSIEFNVDDIDDEDLIPNSDVVITLTKNNYIKKSLLDEYRLQSRGGKGSKGASINADDEIDIVLSCSNLDRLLMFSNFGKVYQTKAYKINFTNKTSKGIPIVNVLNLEADEKIISIREVKKESDFDYLFFITKQGIGKKVDTQQFFNINSNGKKAIVLRENDELLDVIKVNDDQELIIANQKNVIRTKIDQIRELGRSSQGVRFMKLGDSQRVISVTKIDHENDLILTVTKKGYTKLTPAHNYRLTARNSKGVKNLSSNFEDEIVAIFKVDEKQEVMIITNLATTIRMKVDEVREVSKNSKGVKGIKLNENEEIVSVALISQSEEEEINDND